MFKSILSSRRIPSSEFDMLTALNESSANGKENYPALATTTNVPNTKTRNDKSHKKSKTKDHIVADGGDMEHEFDKLLDDLQIPPTLRPKLATMEPSVKAAMLKSSKTLAVAKPVSPPRTPKGLRKAYSSESLVSSPRPQYVQLMDDHDLFRPPQISAYGMDTAGSSNSPSRSFATHGRGTSMDARRDPVAQRKTPATVSTRSKDDKTKNGPNAPSRFCNALTSNSSLHLDVEVVKKLRLLLRNEPAGWTQEFVQKGGYTALVTRLNELLEIEWREEQHDDQLLHELLRCFKALSTSTIGCAALRSFAPTPFAQLVSLLYSDKKPGDVGSRQLIVELLLILFDLYPRSSLPSAGNPHLGSTSHIRSHSVPWERDNNASSSNLISLPAPHPTFFSFIRSLLLTPAPPPSENPKTPVEPHAFIEELHIPRIYKTYLQELSDVCRDYFWVFCHPNNTIWSLDEVDEGKVERPRAPGGMTGGVEFEAMSYMTMHLKLINAIAKVVEDLDLPKESELSPHRFHSDMFLSGIDRILLIARKASTTYYPTLHLEIARYIAAVGRAGYETPWTVSKLVGSPPSSLRKPITVINPESTFRDPGYVNVPKPMTSRTPPTSSSPGGSPTKRTSVIAGPRPPVLPNTRKVTPMFD
ncbi:armadillo-type protein [Cristinia sonorae]|uniref:Armadillo-type protein n=1 Tax=Cristinia sonorae TaxID=1940300 RepID=A0A8K0UNM2_9AGAR|nr:armadillo-type protein [Cristinia sonorae]